MEEGKSATDVSDEEVVDLVGQYFMDAEFQAVVDDFVQEHCMAFADLTEAQVEGAENSHEHWKLYRQFIGLCETTIEGFLATHGLTSQRLHDCLQRAAGKDDQAAGMFLNILIAASDYETFLSMMHEEGKEAAERFARK